MHMLIPMFVTISQELKLLAIVFESLPSVETQPMLTLLYHLQAGLCFFSSAQFCKFFGWSCVSVYSNIVNIMAKRFIR
jgi:hypothetical protein